ncbi:hypothetical protein IP84_09310 [beta proteobacterium AAP99]|nr:hypothetical protein IP84_09310 [beta proteobacterium AAP99]
MPVQRGSARLLAAFKARSFSEEAIRELAAHLDKSPASVEGALVKGGSAATGVSLTLAYSGDDVPQCGNDMAFWLAWLRRHGGGGFTPRRPRIIINGIPFPDWLRLELSAGEVINPAVNPAVNAFEIQDLREIGGGLRG